MASGDGCGVDLEKCKGLLIAGLTKIQLQQHSAQPLTAKGGHYLEELLLRLLASLFIGQPKTVQDARDQVTRKFPDPLSDWALKEADKAQEKGKKKVAFPVDKLHHVLKEQNTGMDKHVTLFFSAVLEYMASDILKLTTNYAKNIGSIEITDQDIKIAMFADNILMVLFHCDETEEELMIEPDSVSHETVKSNVSYESVVRDLMSVEARYLSDLNLIIKLIKKEFVAQPHLYTDKDIDIIFSNIEDLAELSLKLISLLEEAIEMTDETSPTSLVGSCFEDLAEECSFELYSDYTIAITSDVWRKTFDSILMKPKVTSHLQGVCAGFRNVVAYVLPNLLLAPIYHCFYYIEQIELLEKNSPDVEDKQCLEQALSAIPPIKKVLDAKIQSLPKLRPSEASLRISWRGGPKASKMSDIEKSIDGWWGRTITQSCNEFLHEGTLMRVGNKRVSERHVFLFDRLLISCKANQARLPTVAASQYEYRLKERILIRNATVDDIIEVVEPGAEGKNQFVIRDGEKAGETHIFQAKTKADKDVWMAHLVRLQHRSTFDRMLDQIIREEAAKQELRLPTPEKYRFVEPDSNLNLILEEDKKADGVENQRGKNQVDVIKGGTVLKLVERLTYHLYSDASFTKTFLTTFRSFCKPKDLLALLIERYNIPDPEPTEEQQLAIDRGEIPNREDLKRFRKDYAKPIQLRVMNVIRQWLEHHWYDFERDEDLLRDVEKFIAGVRGKNMKKWARTMEKIIQRKKSDEEDEPEPSFEKVPPLVEWHLTRDSNRFTLFTLHPIEIARQLTLIEFDLYRKVRPSELVGSVWTKVGKETNSPNLLRMIHFSTKITRWISKTIVEIANHEERIAGMIRAIEVMIAMKEQLNNFNGLLEFVAAFNSSAVHRLNHTKESLPDRYSKAIKECMDLCDSRLVKTLERLRSIDPPCVPFVGTFLTNILKTEEGNPHLLPHHPEHLELINFSKRRKVAAIMLEIQQYQNQPYNLQVVPEIRDFFLEVDPLDGRTEKEFNDELFAESLKIEPRDLDRPPKFPRAFTDKEIKPPGTMKSKPKMARAVTREDIRFGSPSLRSVTRNDSIKSMSHLEKRHSLFEVSLTQKPQSLDTLSVKSFAVLSPEPSSSTSPKAESPPPRPPPREPRVLPREQKVRNSDLVSAPPMVGGQSAFSFDLPSDRLNLFRSSGNPFSNSPITPNVPVLTPATAPARTFNGTLHKVTEPEPISPPATELLLDDDATPPPIPPRDSSSQCFGRGINGGCPDGRLPHFPKSVDRTSPELTPPPIPPRDPPSLPPRDPVRPPPPYTRNYPEPFTPHVNANGGRYVFDPTWDPGPPVSAHGNWGSSSPNTFENFPPAPPYSETDDQNTYGFAVPLPSAGILARTAWDGSTPSFPRDHGNAFPRNIDPTLSPSTDAPPPIPKRQPSTMNS